MSAPRLARFGPLGRFAWTVVGYNLLVILWGALVRATGSGAGCGSHWPLCDGQVVPRAPSVEQAIEYAHRVSSGLALLAVVALAIAAFRARPAGHPVRRAAIWAVVFIVIEALLGAGLVLFELVDENASAARAIAMAAHLVNTFLLLGALALTARAAGERPAPRLAARARTAAAWIATLVLLAIAGASGAVAALGDTLFPARDLAHAIEQDLSPTSHALLRLRLAHPALAALAAAAALALAGRWTLTSRSGSPWPRAVVTLTLAQIVVGVVNVALLAPVALQLVHLLLADLVWIALIVAGVDELAAD